MIQDKKHVISVLVENNAGILSRVTGLFARRGFNISSLAVGETEDPTISRITIVVKENEGDKQTLEQITKQLNKLIDVIKLKAVSVDEFISRELVLVKVSCVANKQAELIEIAEIYGAKISDKSPTTITFELSESEERLSIFLELLRPYKIKEIARTGAIALEKGNKSLR